MSDSIFKIFYFIGLIAGAVIRVLYMRQHKHNRIKDNRMTVLEKSLLFLPFMGMQVIPLIYVLTSWLDLADYHLPTRVGVVAGLVGVAVFAVALWLLWRSHADLGRNWSPTYTCFGFRVRNR